MNREIKFRAWDETTSNPKMVLWDDLKSSPCEYVFILSKDVTLMQYTGCKDKNGKEIYEGDICYDGIQKFEVKYEIRENTHSGHGDFTYTVSCGFHLGGWGNESRKIEVIGNIYENSELK